MTNHLVFMCGGWQHESVPSFLYQVIAMKAMCGGGWQRESVPSFLCDRQESECGG